MKTSMTILGSCVSNQMIRYGSKIDIIPFLVKGATTIINPYTYGQLTPPGIEEIFDELDLSGSGYSEMIINSVKFALKNDIKSFCRGKWLVIDLATLNNPIWEFTNKEGEKFFLSERPLCENSCNKAIIQKFANKYNYETVRIENPLTDFTFERQKELLKDFADKILEIYKPEKIIFSQSFYTSERIRKDGTLDLNGFNSEKIIKENAIARKNQEFFSKYIKCHIVRIPDNTLANDDSSLHTNGSPLHYDKLFYEYGIKALDIITDEVEEAETNSKLSSLLDEYVEKFKILKGEASAHTCDRLAKIKVLDSYGYSLCEYYESQKGTFLNSLRARYSMNGLPDYPFKNCRTLDEYMEKLIAHKPNYVIFMTVKDTANAYWNNWKTKDALGITSDLSRSRRKSFCSVIIPGQGIVRESFDNSAHECTLEHSIVIENNSVSYSRDSKGRLPLTMPHVFIASLSSKAREGESQYIWSRIMINNIEYSMNRTGANFVIFSPDDLCVIDSFYVNFLRDKNLIIRRV